MRPQGLSWEAEEGPQTPKSPPCSRAILLFLCPAPGQERGGCSVAGIWVTVLAGSLCPLESSVLPLAPNPPARPRSPAMGALAGPVMHSRSPGSPGRRPPAGQERVAPWPPSAPVQALPKVPPLFPCAPKRPPDRGGAGGVPPSVGLAAMRGWGLSQLLGAGVPSWLLRTVSTGDVTPSSPASFRAGLCPQSWWAPRGGRGCEGPREQGQRRGC